MLFAYLATGWICVAMTPSDSVVPSAAINAETLAVGEEYEIALAVQLGSDVSVDAAGIPQMLLQIDVPKCVKLLGKEVKTLGELSKNEFLEAPYERLVDAGETTIGFKVIREPKEGDAFGLNLLAYTGGEDSADHRFVRQRLSLPIQPNSVGTLVSEPASNWGRNKTLHIGKKATFFSLPTAAGEKVSLKKYRGKKNVVVTTYRAHW